MEEKTEKGQQIGQLPKRDVLTGNEQFPFQEDRENGSITPNALRVSLVPVLRMTKTLCL